MKYHKLAAFFPMLPKEEMKLLVADIKKNGQLEPIVLYEGEILDGRNRYEACERLGIKSKTRVLSGGVEPKDYVIATNMRRRHLTPAQKGMVLVDSGILEIGRGRGVEPSGDGSVSVKEAAEITGVSEPTIERVMRAAVYPDLAKAMREPDHSGNQLSAAEAAREARFRDPGKSRVIDTYKDAPEVGAIMRNLNWMTSSVLRWSTTLEVGKIDILGHRPLMTKRIDEVVDGLEKFKKELEDYDG